MPLGAYAQDGDNSLITDSQTTITTTVETPDANTAANENDPLFEQSFFEEIGSPVDFTNPWMLGVLPPALLIFWMVMRSVPPRPKEEDFPFINLLFDLESDEQEADKMPWWQRAVNLGAVSAIAIAAAGPHLNQTPNFEGDGPVLIALDNGFAAAPDWNARVEEATDIIRHAHNQNRDIIILPTAAPDTGTSIVHSGAMDARAALDYLHALQPQSWSVNYGDSIEALETLDGDFGGSYWLSNGLEGEHSLEFAAAMQERGPLSLLENGADRPVHLMLEPEYTNGNYTITVKRSDAEIEESLTVSAYNEDHALITSQSINFAEGELEAQVTFDAESGNDAGLRLNDVFRFAINEKSGAGTTVLVDEKWKPRSVGLIVQNQFETESLLGEARFIQAALGTHVDLRTSVAIVGDDHETEFANSIEAMIDSDEFSIIVIPDAVTINEISRAKLEQWVADGGTLLRFAGPNMARSEHTDDPLLPVDLRRGTRTLGEGGLSNNNAQGTIGSFSSDSPFAGMEIDEDIHIERQILAQPGPDTDSRIWASLDDGTPLVSASDLGQGKVVLFHTTANTRWGDLSLSPMFIDLLLGVVQQSNSVQDTSDYELPSMPPISVLDGFGDLESPITSVEPISQTVLDNQDMGPLHPPGFYGNTVTRYAFNISDTITDLESLGPMPDSIDRQTYAQSTDEIDLTHPLWAGGLGLLAISSMILFAQQGHFDRKGARRRRKSEQRHTQNNNFAGPQGPEV